MNFLATSKLNKDIFLSTISWICSTEIMLNFSISINILDIINSNFSGDSSILQDSKADIIAVSILVLSNSW